MSIQEMHYEFKVRANRLDTQHYQDLPPYTIDSLLNNAHNHFLEHYAYVSRLPYETSQARLDMLSNLVIGFPEQPALLPVEVEPNVYEVKLSTLVQPYAHLVRVYADGSCGLVNVKVVPINSLNRMLTDELQKPSVKWKRLLATLRKTSNDINPSLYIYGAEGITIDSIKIEFLKQPKYVFIGGYNSIDYDVCVQNNGINCNQYYNIGTPPVDSEIAEVYHSLLIDIAVREFSRYTDNINKLQTLDNKISLTT